MPHTQAHGQRVPPQGTILQRAAEQTDAGARLLGVLWWKAFSHKWALPEGSGLSAAPGVQPVSHSAGAALGLGTKLGTGDGGTGAGGGGGHPGGPCRHSSPLPGNGGTDPPQPGRPPGTASAASQLAINLSNSRWFNNQSRKVRLAMAKLQPVTNHCPSLRAPPSPNSSPTVCGGGGTSTHSMCGVALTTAPLDPSGQTPGPAATSKASEPRTQEQAWQEGSAFSPWRAQGPSRVASSARASRWRGEHPVTCRKCMRLLSALRGGRCRVEAGAWRTAGRQGTSCLQVPGWQGQRRGWGSSGFTPGSAGPWVPNPSSPRSSSPASPETPPLPGSCLTAVCGCRTRGSQTYRHYH